MNGLKFIRTQCNISLSELAMALGISRQMVSAWENEKKEISSTRLEQLSEYFGIDSSYFGEIDDIQKQEILSKAMFRWGKGEDEHYLYRYDSKDGKVAGQSITFALKERECLISEEYQEKKRIQKEIVSQIDKQIAGPIQNHLSDQMLFMNRGINYYGYCLDNMNAAFSKSPAKKMIYYFRLLEVMKAISMAFDVKCELGREQEDYTYSEDPAFVKQISELIREHMYPMLEKTDEMEKQMRSPENRIRREEYKKAMEDISVEEACKYAKEQLRSSEIPDVATSCTVHF